MMEDENKIYYCPECGLSLCNYKGIYCSCPYYQCVKCKRNWQFDEVILDEKEKKQ